MLAEEFFGHGVVEFQEELVLAGDFGQEIFSSKFHCGIELGFGKAIEAIDAEVFPVWGPTDGCFMTWDPALATFDDPFQDTEIFSEAWPQEFAIRIFSEPVDVEDSGESSDVFSHIEPVGKVVTHVVTAER